LPHVVLHHPTDQYDFVLTRDSVASFWHGIPVIQVYGTALAQQFCTPFGGQVLEWIAAAWLCRQDDSIWEHFER
jgi:hypothetical protein